MKVGQSRPTVCNPMDCVACQAPVHGILQARILEWVAIPSPGDLPNPGIKPRSPALQADSLPSEPPGKPSKHCEGRESKIEVNFKVLKRKRDFERQLSIVSYKTKHSHNI